MSRTTRALGWACVGLLLADALIAALDVANVWSELRLLRTEVSPFFAERAIAEAASRATLLGWADRLAMIATAACFVPFFVRAYEALPAPRQRPRWAWLGWFVPIANLYVPWRIAKEIHAPDDPAAPAWPVFVWWSTWLASRLLGLLGILASRQGDLEALLLLDLAAACTTVAAALSGAHLVKTWVLRSARLVASPERA